jgi:uncharacterized protein with HEPN domain
VTARPSREVRQRLTDIVTAIARIRQAERLLFEAEHANDEASLQIAFDAVLYNLVVIGEAVKALPAGVASRRPEVAWRDVVDMRNFLSHKYFRVSPSVVRTLDEPLERLRVACEQLAGSIDEP